MEFTVSLLFECVNAENPLEATKKVAKSIENSTNELIYSVTNEETGEGFTVDLSEKGEHAVSPDDFHETLRG